LFADSICNVCSGSDVDGEHQRAEVVVMSSISLSLLWWQESKPVSMDTSESSPFVAKADMNETQDMYKRYKSLQKQLEFLETQEEYLKDEMKVGAWVHFLF
jgi:hypothetical protein